MSDTMTNTDFNDVLSSIRRLVSKDDEKKTAVSGNKPDRFILTPAHRVQGEVLPILGVIAPVQPQENPEETDVAISDSDEDNDTDEIANKAEYLIMEAAWKAELSRVSERRKEQALKDGTKEASDQGAGVEATLETRIAELEEAVSHVPGEWDPDGTEPEISRPPRRHIFEVVENENFQPTTNAPDQPSEKPAATPLKEVAKDVVAPPVVDAEVAPEKVQDPEPTPMFSHAAVKPRAPYLLSDPVTDASAPTAVADKAAEPCPKLTSPPAQVVEEDDVFLDVEALRNMINEIVRDELRGKMGEDITRSLRRMVRQEIGRTFLPKNPESED